MFAMPRLRLLGALVIGGALAALLALVAFSPAAQADHSLGYHWARQSNPFTLILDDNMSDDWDPHLDTVSDDWSKSIVLDTTVRSDPDDAGSRKSCKATSGRVEVCNARYGNSGWLALAQVWLRRDPSHIVRGSVKLNEYYPEFSDGNNPDGNNAPAWRQSVLCEEVGHTLGLDHQDEDFDDPNLGSCMDYTDDPDGTLAVPPQLSNVQPNSHDYEELEDIYEHLDETTTVSSATAARKMPPAASRGTFNSKAEWGRKIRESRDGHLELWERRFGDGFRLITWVIQP